MLKPLLAISLLAFPVASVTAQTDPARWTVAGSTQGCAVHTSSQQEGTVVSILAGPGQESLLFLVQNPAWSSLEDGGSYDIAVEFDDSGPWQLKAVAKTEIDQDGPGLMFAVPPGQKQGNDFITEFVQAAGMKIDGQGQRLSSMELGSGRSAMTALAQCIGRVFANQPVVEEPKGLDGAPAITI